MNTRNRRGSYIPATPAASPSWAARSGPSSEGQVLPLRHPALTSAPRTARRRTSKGRQVTPGLREIEGSQPSCRRASRRSRCAGVPFRSSSGSSSFQIRRRSTFAPWRVTTPAMSSQSRSRPAKALKTPLRRADRGRRRLPPRELRLRPGHGPRLQAGHLRDPRLRVAQGHGDLPGLHGPHDQLRPAGLGHALPLRFAQAGGAACDL